MVLPDIPDIVYHRLKTSIRSILIFYIMTAENPGIIILYCISNTLKQFNMRFRKFLPYFPVCSPSTFHCKMMDIFI